MNAIPEEHKETQLFVTASEQLCNVLGIKWL